MSIFIPIDSTKEVSLFAESIEPDKRGHLISLNDGLHDNVMSVIFGDKGSATRKIHDANFAFLSTSLAKLHEKLYEPKHFVTYAKDINIDVGGGFVDYVESFSVNWAGIMNEFRNVTGNNANFIPRVNAGLVQNKVNVYTFQVAYDLRFIEMKKMDKIRLQKSLETIYSDIIGTGFDFFAQKVAYTGINNDTGLFNSDDKVMTSTIDNSETSGEGFEGLTDTAIVSFFNGVFQTCLIESGMNPAVLPNKFLVPTFVGRDLTSRMSALYTSTLRQFILDHNLGNDETSGELKITIESRPQLDNAGTLGKGRIIAYRNEKDFVRMDMPFPLQHFITLPNIERMAYTSAFVAQISAMQFPYSTSNTEFGPISYWDFTTKVEG